MIAIIFLFIIIIAYKSKIKSKQKWEPGNSVLIENFIQRQVTDTQLEGV